MGPRILPDSPKEGFEDRPQARPHYGWIWQVLYILYSLEVGGFLIVFPWMAIWENNYFLYLFPHFRPIVGNAFLKGAVLGLGIVNILIGIEEIFAFKKNFRRYSTK